MRVAFHVSHFSFRGTEVAVYDYAHYNEKLLGNKSIIVAPTSAQTSEKSHKDVLAKFRNRFQILFYDSNDSFKSYLINSQIDVLYYIKYGVRDELPVFNGKIKTVIHCVYNMTDPHGDVYAGVSECVTRNKRQDEKKVFPYVPHIISLPEESGSFRSKLSIPDDAIVFGRHGGSDTFNIEFVKDVILKVVSEHKNIYFIFAVRPDIIAEVYHPNIIFIKSFVDPSVKRKFINTCDAMIHACDLGESFGISILEFLYCDKPVITFVPTNESPKGRNIPFYNNQHLLNLENKGICYSTPNELYQKLTAKPVSGGLKYLTDKFSPENVMSKFKSVFLD
jgi:glycosyltransferase involved in cell wall biosynthesis